MGDFPRSPKFLKGALVAYDNPILGPIPNIIVFQYNPDTLTRSLTRRNPTAPAGGQTQSPVDPFRITGPPIESINVTVEIDAVDQLAEPLAHPHTVLTGIHPTLAALEMLLYPPISQMIAAEALATLGVTQVSPATVPIILFVWGPARVVPVRVTSFSVTEEAFDQLLNPIRAKVTMAMQVMTYKEMASDNLGYSVYLAHQTVKEVLAKVNLLNSAENVVGMLPL